MGKTELKLEIDAQLLEQARAAKVRMDLLVERALKVALGPAAAEERAKAWASENADAIASYNRCIAEDGEFGREWRNW
jgi:antitoxin CcdA